MAVVHGDTCIELFAFAVNSLSLNKKLNIVLRLARLMIPLLNLISSHLQHGVYFNSLIFVWFVVV